MKKELTRMQLIAFIQENNAINKITLEQFSTEDLKRAYESPQGAYVYINALIAVKKNKD